jgi:hypothetical protein
MKRVIIPILLAGSFISLSAAGGRCSPQGVLTIPRTHQLKNLPR